MDFLDEWMREMPSSTLQTIIRKELPDYPPSTSAVVWDNWSTRDNGTLPYPENAAQEL